MSKDVNITIENSKQCVKWKPKDEEYWRDPCCSDRAAIEKCCLPRNVETSIKVLLEKLTPSDLCNTPTRITAMLSNAVDYAPQLEKLGIILQRYLDTYSLGQSGQNFISSEEDSILFDDFTQFEGNINLLKFCGKEVTSKSCTINQECPYAPNQCDSSTNKCVFSPPLAKINVRNCLRLFMSPELRPQFEIEVGENEVKDVDGLPPNYCTDVEYDNPAGGLCTFMPNHKLFYCDVGLNTQTGICFSNESQSENYGYQRLGRQRLV